MLMDVVMPKMRKVTMAKTMAMMVVGESRGCSPEHKRAAAYGLLTLEEVAQSPHAQDISRAPETPSFGQCWPTSPRIAAASLE